VVISDNKEKQKDDCTTSKHISTLPLTGILTIENIESQKQNRKNCTSLI